MLIYRQGKNRKEINKDLAEKLNEYPFNTSNTIRSYDLIAQTVFANKSTYKNLIDELILSASKSNFYFGADFSKDFDNNDSKISVDFKITNKNTEELNEKIKISDGKWWKGIVLAVSWFVGNGQDKYFARTHGPFTVVVMEENYAQEKLLLRMSKVRETLVHGLIKYEPKTKIEDRYGELRAEIHNEVDRLIKNILKPEELPIFSFTLRAFLTNEGQGESDVISVANLYQGRYYGVAIIFSLHVSGVLDLPALSDINFYISVEK